MRVADQHRMTIARKTMRLSCFGARMLGGMDHVDAAFLLERALPKDCMCRKSSDVRTEPKDSKQGLER